MDENNKTELEEEYVLPPEDTTIEVVIEEEVDYVLPPEVEEVVIEKSNSTEEKVVVEKDRVIDEEDVEPAEVDYVMPVGTDYSGKISKMYASVQEHLREDYRKQYFFRRLFSCFLTYIIVALMINSDNQRPVLTFIVAITWTAFSWVFWHYSFWSFQGGALHNMSSGIVHIGSIFSVIWKVVVQNILLVAWVGLIAPFSGIKTWKKAEKNAKVLYVNNKDSVFWED